MLKKLLKEQEYLNQQLSERNKNLVASLRDSEDARTKLQKQLEEMTDYVIQMEEKVYKSNKISLELLKQLKDAENEIETL